MDSLDRQQDSLLFFPTFIGSLQKVHFAQLSSILTT